MIEKQGNFYKKWTDISEDDFKTCAYPNVVQINLPILPKHMSLAIPFNNYQEPKKHLRSVNSFHFMMHKATNN